MFLADFGIYKEEKTKMKKRIAVVCLILVLVCGAIYVFHPISLDDVVALVSNEQPEEPEVEEVVYPEGVPVFLPVLIYHHFVEGDEVSLGTMVTANSFAEQIAALKEAGYNAITLDELLAFAECRGELPENPILITMDDGYNSNFTLAAPILEEHGYHAVVFAIGTNVGHPNHAHTGIPLVPARFTWEDACDWLEKGVMEVQSHTYDMHQKATDGFSGREGVLIKEGESEEDYRKALQADFAQAKAQLEENTGKEMIALAFPYGYYSDIALEEAKNSGVKITFAADHGGNYIVSGDPESLHLLLRINVFDTFSGEMLLRKIKDAERATPMPEIPVEESTEESETEEE